MRMSTSPFGPELELVDVGLGLRARPPADLALPEGRAERHAQVGALTPDTRSAGRSVESSSTQNR